MKTFRPFNLNDHIKVKLNKHGHKIHRTRYDDLMLKFVTKPFDYVPPKEDENGWSQWQAWEFMQLFGQHMGNGFNNPCETGIYIQEQE